MNLSKVGTSLEKLTSDWPKASKVGQTSASPSKDKDNSGNTSVKAGSVDKGTTDTAELGKFRKAASEFESIFLEMVLKSMRSTVMKGGMIDGGNAEEIYQGMLDQEYAANLSKDGMTGMAEALERQLIGAKTQEKSPEVRAFNQKKFHPYGG